MLSHFEAPYVLYAVGIPSAPGSVAAVDGRIAELRAATGAWLSRSTYFNLTEGTVDASTLYPGGNYERLVEIRAAVDPDGVFHAKHTID